MPEVLLGVDVGTGSTKGVLVTPSGEILARHEIAHDVDSPAPGFFEHDAETVWWGEVVAVIHALLAARPDARVLAVAVSAIGPCVLPVDARGEALRPGILYGIDTRAEQQIQELNFEFGEEALFARSHMALTSQATLPKILWLRRHEPEVFEEAAVFTTASAFVTSRLTGRHVMNRHEAGHLLPLYDPRTREWDAGMLERFGLTGRLPELGWSDELAGHVTREAARLTGLPEGIPVAVGAVDALSEAISVGVVEPGDLMVMYGSTTFFVLVQDAPTPDPRVWSVPGAFAGQTNLAAGMGTTGSLTKWFRDELAPGADFATLFEEARGVPAGADGLLVLPYFAGERTPINDPRARGVVAGLTLGHTRAHVFRAVLEGVGHGVRHNLATFAEMGARIKRVVAVGGGTRDTLWPQIVSDIAGVTQELPGETIGASYGDAFLAGLAAGVLRREDLARWVRIERVVTPDPTGRALHDDRHTAFLALYPAARDVLHALGRA